MDQLLVASDVVELAENQRHLIASMEAKLAAAKTEARAAHDVMSTMTNARLDRGQAGRLHRRATARVTYLTKIVSVLKAGYCMMPDMPGDIVAVRHSRIRPSPQAMRWRDWRGSVPDERPAGLEEGDGEYVSPRQAIESQTVPSTGYDGKPSTKTQWRAVALCDPDGIGRRFMRAEVMTRTARAMQLKVFDEIVCVTGNVNRRRSRDPIVLGRIVNPITEECAAFLIAHFIDTTVL
ncbi:MAG: hypothetical protein IT438_16360 [Phycisphaerales bacterium]|nr:hypothetical protein [Phycisphaerales bacterium]